MQPKQAKDTVQFVGRLSRGVLIFVIGGVLMFTGMTLSIRIPSLPSAAGNGAGFGACATVFVVCGLAQVKGTAGILEIRNFFLWYRIPWHEILYVEDTNGMQVVLKSNRQVASFVFGSSVIASFNGNRRSKAVAAKIRAAILDSTPSNDTVRISINPVLVIGLCVLPASYLGLGVLLWQFHQ